MTTVTEAAAAARATRRRATKVPRAKRLAHGLAFDRVGAVYVWLGIIVLFSIWVPDTFPSVATAKQILNANAITALAALSITIPLAARVFDLSFAGVMVLTGVTVAHLIAKDGVALVPAIGIALAVGLGVGVINAVVVVVMRIDSFIATLATGSLIAALITMVTNEVPITDAKLGGAFANIGQTSIGGITLSVVYCAVVALAIWYLLEHTATGRRLYATGFNPDAARLAGVRVDRLRFVVADRLGRAGRSDRDHARVEARERVAERRHSVPAARVRRGLPRRDAAQARALQRRRDDHRRAAARHRRHRPRRWPTRRSGPETCSSASC